MANKLQGTCSVCLREMQLGGGDKPIRHGFSAIGVRHGANTGYHTGPCAGANFPNLNVSTEGTKAGLKIAKERLDLAEEALRRLATNPDLDWYPDTWTGRVRMKDTTRKVTLVYGNDERSMGDGRPSYAYEHKGRVADQENRRSAAEQMIRKYEHVLATWSPEKYPVTGAAAKVETVHLERQRTHRRFGTWTGVTCKLTRPGVASDKLVKTTDITKVNCKSCQKKALGTP